MKILAGWKQYSHRATVHTRSSRITTRVSLPVPPTDHR